MSLPRSLVLLSGGLDSVVNARQAKDQTHIAGLLFFDYGQRAAVRELEAVKRVSEALDAPLTVIPLEWMKSLDQGLTQGAFPRYDAARLDDAEYAGETARAVWVPNRNGVLINIAAAFAEKEKIDTIIVGFNREEGATFSDNTPEYLERANAALEYSTLSHPIVASYTIDMDKTQILEWGQEIEAPLHSIWSCYDGGEKMCGVCESCRRLKRALRENGRLESFQQSHFRGFADLS